MEYIVEFIDFAVLITIFLVMCNKYWNWEINKAIFFLIALCFLWMEYHIEENYRSYRKNQLIFNQ